MWAELAAFVKANTTESLLITIVGTMLVWLYKQFKDMSDRQQQEKDTAIRAQQGLLARLEFTIALVLHQRQPGHIEQLSQLLGDYAPYLTSTQRKLIRDYYRSFDPSVLHTLQALFVHQADKLSQQMEKNAEDQDARWLLYIKKLYEPIWPIIFISVILLYFFTVYEMIKLGTTTWARANILILGVSLLLSTTLFLIMMITWFQKSLGKQGPKRWTAIIIVMVSPMLFFLLNRWDIAIPVFLLQIGLLLAVSKFKRPTEIISP